MTGTPEAEPPDRSIGGPQPTSLYGGRHSSRTPAIRVAATYYLGSGPYVFGSPVSRFVFALVGAILLIGNHAISEYLLWPSLTQVQRAAHSFGRRDRPLCSCTIVNMGFLGWP